jgi:hypothetical protein
MWWLNRTRSYIERWSDHLGTPAVLSQIEGCWYPLGFARETLALAAELLPTQELVPHEEFVLSTAASALVASKDTPLVFSEVQRAEALIASRIRAMPWPAIATGVHLLVRRVISRNPRLWQISADDLKRVHAGFVPGGLLTVREGGIEWGAYNGTPPAAVKRIPLRQGNPMRSLAQSLSCTNLP